MYSEDKMIHIRPLIQRSPAQIESKFGVDDWTTCIALNPESRYVDIDNRSDMFELISDRKFSGKHLQMLFIITTDQEAVIGYDCPSGYNLWADLLKAAEEFASRGKTKRSYGVDPLIMEIFSVSNGTLKFTIYYELDCSKKYVDISLPSKEFMLSLTTALEHFLKIMINEYNVEVGDEEIINRVERLAKRFSILT
ncbi:hypothetical protein AB6A23_12690 [Paenibacillus tarimensis]